VGAFACAALAASLVCSCAPHQNVPGQQPDPPALGDIIASEDVSVSASDGITFSLRGATLNIPANSLGYDAIVRLALCRSTALPEDVPLPAGEKAFAVVYAYTDVRVGGDWPLDFHLISDFGDAQPSDPGLRVYRLNVSAGAYDQVTAASVTETSVTLGIEPGYTLVTVPEGTPRAIGLVGSVITPEILFPSTVVPGVDNAFCIRSDGTDLQRLTNSLAPGFADRPYLSRDARRIAIVRSNPDAPAEVDRLFLTTPTDPIMHLQLIAEAPAGRRMGDVCFEPTAASMLVAGAVAGSGVIGDGVFRIYVTSASRPELVYDDPAEGPPHSVALSPDGLYMAVTTSRYYQGQLQDSNYDAILIPVAGPFDDASIVRLTYQFHHPGGSGSPIGGRPDNGIPAGTVDSVCYAPDGSAVYFGATVDGQHSLYRAAPDGSSVTRVEQLDEATAPAVSPQGDILIGQKDGQLVEYDMVNNRVRYLGPPANGFGFGLVSDRVSKISWAGR